MYLLNSENLNLVPPLLIPSKSNSPPAIMLITSYLWSEKSEVTWEPDKEKSKLLMMKLLILAELTWMLLPEKLTTLKLLWLKTKDFTKSITQFSNPEVKKKLTNKLNLVTECKLLLPWKLKLKMLKLCMKVLSKNTDKSNKWCTLLELSWVKDSVVKKNSFKSKPPLTPNSPPTLELLSHLKKPVSLTDMLKSLTF